MSVRVVMALALAVSCLFALYAPAALTSEQVGLWLVIDHQGQIIGEYQREDQAIVAASNWAIANPGLQAHIEPPRWVVSSDGAAPDGGDNPDAGGGDGGAGGDGAGGGGGGDGGVVSGPGGDGADPEPEFDPTQVAHIIELGDGQQALDIPRDLRSPDKWVVVRGSRDAVITNLNYISTPSRIRFEGVTVATKVEGVAGGEFSFSNCLIDVIDSICWGVDKAMVINCDIISQSNVFAGGIWHYIARGNTILHYREDLWRGGTGELIDTIIVHHERVEGDHPDLFEIARGHGFHNLTFRNLSGPGGQPAILEETQGISGGDISNAIFENINVQIVQDSGIGGVQLGGSWKNVTFKNVKISGAAIRARDDFAPENVKAIDSSSGFSALPGVIIE